MLEYRRLTDEVPSVCSQTLTAHFDEVLHVSFSHSGSEVITCSKDGTFIMWEVGAGNNLLLRHHEDMTQYGWIYTWSARYNSSDTLVLVAGVVDEVDGKIAVFERSGGSLRLISHTDNSPYDVMGSWCGETSWLSGDMGALGLDTNINLCQAQSETVSPHCNLVLKFRPGFHEVRNYLRCLHVSTTVPDLAARKGKVVEQHQDPHPALLKSLETKVCLVFLCSDLTTSPHQLGFKIISGDNLGAVPVISQPDRIIDMLGHIVGISLDRQSRHLFVNVRPWPEGAQPHPDYPPPIAREIETRVVELSSLTVSSLQYRGHKGFTDTTEAFYIYLDTSNHLLCSGSEDGLGYIWDRQYGCQLATLRHQDVVNCTAINPSDPEMVVTVSDDQTIKVWLSKQRQRKQKS